MSSRTDEPMTPPVQEPGAVLSPTERFERALGEQAESPHVLVLYVAGSAPRSLLAVANVRKLCQEHLPGSHELEVVDIYQQPALAEEAGILAVPALIRTQPPPEVRLVGDMTDTRRLLLGLGLPFGSVSGEAA
jgi:circadian clock protein KaiB